MTYAFVREEGFYLLDLGSDDEAIKNAHCNPGTLRVETLLGQVVWNSKSNA